MEFPTWIKDLPVVSFLVLVVAIAYKWTLDYKSKYITKTEDRLDDIYIKHLLELTQTLTSLIAMVKDQQKDIDCFVTEQNTKLDKVYRQVDKVLHTLSYLVEALK